MNLGDFLQEVLAAAQASSICGNAIVLRQTAASLKIRISIIDDQFIDCFHSELSGCIAFALIKNSQRIFGADNTGGWHLHPFEDPSRHEPLNGPMSIMEFIQTIELRYRQS
jgi:hypothetical protein